MKSRDPYRQQWRWRVVTRTEWRGKGRTFRELDRDNDGVLSLGEVR